MRSIVAYTLVMYPRLRINLRYLVYVCLVTSWLFFGWSPIQQNLFIPKAHAASQTFTTSGQWQAPVGVTSVTVEAWGGGGGGGGRGASTGQSGGGGGGAYASKTITVNPLQTYAYTVGAAVTGGNANGLDGNFSQWETGLDVKAAGGKGGASTTTKGLGGAVIDSVGTTVFKGGDGADGGTVSGGGGGGAGSTGAGGNASAGTAGTGTSQGGGTGGAGVTNANGIAGSSAGGGGSGARRTNGNRSGGGGATGQIRITYNSPPAFTVTPTDSPDPVTIGLTVTFSATATDSESNSWYLAVCKTNTVTAGVPPVCAANQTYCVSASTVASGSQNSCAWTADQIGNQPWFAFACDNGTTPACSAANTTNSPIKVSPIISVTITSDGTIDYGTLNSGESKSTLELADTQTAQNDSNVAEDFSIKTSSPAGWTLGSATGTNIFTHEFSSDGGGNWTKFTTADAYQTLTTNITAGSSQIFDLRFTAPNPSIVGGQKTINVTIQATEH